MDAGKAGETADAEEERQADQRQWNGEAMDWIEVHLDFGSESEVSVSDKGYMMYACLCASVCACRRPAPCVSRLIRYV